MRGKKENKGTRLEVCMYTQMVLKLNLRSGSSACPQHIFIIDHSYWGRVGVDAKSVPPVVNLYFQLLHDVIETENICPKSGLRRLGSGEIRTHTHTEREREREIG